MIVMNKRTVMINKNSMEKKMMKGDDYDDSKDYDEKKVMMVMMMK